MKELKDVSEIGLLVGTFGVLALQAREEIDLGFGWRWLAVYGNSRVDTIGIKNN